MDLLASMYFLVSSSPARAGKRHKTPRKRSHKPEFFRAQLSHALQPRNNRINQLAEMNLSGRDTYNAPDIVSWQQMMSWCGGLSRVGRRILRRMLGLPDQLDLHVVLLSADVDKH